MTNERLQYLFDQYLQQQLTAEETIELQQLLADEQHEKSIKAVIDRYTAIPVYSMRPGAANDILSAIVSSPVPVAPTVHKLPPKRYIGRWVAAAAAAASLIGGVYIWQTKKQPARQVAAVVNNTGSNKAILTLSDGSTVTLDSANKDLRQGTTAIHQQGDTLQYTANSNASSITYNTLTVPKGGQFQVVLPDGTKVWLNAATRLRYPTVFTGPDRTVELEGQAYFEVAQQSTQPFHVHVHNAAINVLGTAFDIMAYADEPTMNATLVQGAIAIRNGAITKKLQPGQQAVLKDNTLQVMQADIDKVTAWKSGFFELDNTDLPTLMRQLSRWYDVEMIDKTGGAAGLFGGRISRKLALKDVLGVLEQYGVHYSIEGRTVTILP